MLSSTLYPCYPQSQASGILENTMRTVQGSGEIFIAEHLQYCNYIVELQQDIQQVTSLVVKAFWVKPRWQSI